MDHCASVRLVALRMKLKNEHNHATKPNLCHSVALSGVVTVMQVRGEGVETGLVKLNPGHAHACITISHRKQPHKQQNKSRKQSSAD